MSFKRVVFPFCLMMLVLSVSEAVAQRTTSAEINPEDALFLKQAVYHADWMIVLGQLAQKQAASLSVRSYGASMVEGYSKELEELNRLARLKNIPLLPDLHVGRQNTTHYFSRKVGADFDRNYISLMVEENRSHVNACQQAIKSVQDDDIRALALANIDKLKAYVDLAHQILTDLPKPVLK